MSEDQGDVRAAGHAAADCTLFVDPSCPFAWITSRWLLEVQTHGQVAHTLGLVSLSVINEHREVEDWYREFNDRAWAPARVALVIEHDHGSEGFRRFYDAYGTLRHVARRKDDDLIADALAAAALGSSLVEAAEDRSLDDALRERTNTVLEPVNGVVGTPIMKVGENAFLGPVLTAIPRGHAAAELFTALTTLAATTSFVEYKRGRVQKLQTS